MSDYDNQTYEIQMYVGGRWKIQAQYPFSERPEALLEAKEMSQEYKRAPIRVVLNDYNERTGYHSESIVYRNKVDLPSKTSSSGRTNWADMAVSSDGRVGYVRHAENDFEASVRFLEEETPKARVSLSMLMGIILIILGVGLATGGGSAGVLALLIKGFGSNINSNTYYFLLITMFMLAFVMGSLATFNYYRNHFDLNPLNGRSSRKKAVVKKSKVSEQMEKAAAEIDKDPVQPVTQEEAPSEPESSDKIEIQIEESDTEEFSEEAEQQKMFMIKFLGVCLGALKGNNAKAENYNRFGLNLFMTGAVYKIAEEYGLNDEETVNILCRILEMLGATTTQAKGFARDHQKHLDNPRHKALFESSGKIALNFNKGDQAAPLIIRETIDEWVNWKAKEIEVVNPHLLTIMFTDMVGSTDLATRHGDFAAQEVLKAHDLIVRTAVTNFGGKEVKHTGDGIMACFKKHEDAILASKEIQRRVEGNNNAGPENPLHIRIGMNAGEPIKKDNDFFGQAVQLAARLSDVAPTDGIAVSPSIVELCGKETEHTFLDQGLRALKGFEKSVHVHFLDWKADPRIIIEEVEVNPLAAQAEAENHDAPDMEVVAEKPDPTDPDFDAGLPVDTK